MVLGALVGGRRLSLPQGWGSPALSPHVLLL